MASAEDDTTGVLMAALRATNLGASVPPSLTVLGDTDLIFVASLAAYRDNAAVLAAVWELRVGLVEREAFFLVRLAQATNARRVIAWFSAHAPNLFAVHRAATHARAIVPAARSIRPT